MDTNGCNEKEQSKTNHIKLMGGLKTNKTINDDHSITEKIHSVAHTQLPELAAEGGDLSCHSLTAVGELLQFSLQLPLLGVGAGVLLLHLLQLPLQLLQPHHRLIQLEGCQRGERGGETEGMRWKRTQNALQRSGQGMRLGERRMEGRVPGV